MRQIICKVNIWPSPLLKPTWIHAFWDSLGTSHLQLQNSALSYTWRPDHSSNNKQKQPAFFSPFLCNGNLSNWTFIGYLLLSFVIVPKMTHLSLNPHLPKPWWELNWHSSANSPATDHRTISVTMIPRPDSFQSFGNNRWVVKLKSLNKEDNINTIRNWSFPQATPSLLPFLATYHITN